MPNIIGLFASGATDSLVAKNGTKELSQSFEYGFWCSRYLSNCNKVPDIIGLFASGPTAPLVAKNGTKELSEPFEDGFLCSSSLNDCIEVAL